MGLFIVRYEFNIGVVDEMRVEAVDAEIARAYALHLLEEEHEGEQLLSLEVLAA